ncbi:MAG: PDDEXK nuclease domain-containing protein [Bacteroidota bacterium]
MENKLSSNKYESLIGSIGQLLQQGREQAARSVNTILVQTYWQIGRHIVEFEQGGKEKAEYGSDLLNKLSKDLTYLYGKGFGRSNLFYIRKLYLAFPNSGTLSHDLEKIQTQSGQMKISGTVSHLLSWSHYYEILKSENELEIGFYTKQCEKENWSVRELKRQMKSMLFHRLALSKDKEGVLKLAKEGAAIQQAEDIIKDPYVLEFLNIPQNEKYLEGDLEEKLIQNLQSFLLELGKGFAFIGRQYKIHIGGRLFFVDLVFYHRILKCFVLFDLKRGEIEHGDIGQMNLYLNYFKKEENTEGDNEPIGVVLGAYKDHILMEYATAGLSNQLFVSKYQLYLPEKEKLEAELSKLLERKEDEQ